MNLTTLRPLTIGEILDGGFTLYRRNFALMFGTALLAFLPALLSYLVHDVLATVVSIPCNIFAIAALIWQVSELYLGRDVDMKSAFKVAQRRFFPVLLAWIVWGLILFIGFLLLFVPGILLAIMFFAVTQVVVLERNSHFLERSRALARESWGKIFLVYLVSTLISYVPMLAFGIGGGLYLRMNAAGAKPPEPGLTFHLLETLLQLLTMPFGVGVMTLLYYDQRVRKEGLDVEVAAQALDGLADQAPEIPRAD